MTSQAHGITIRQAEESDVEAMAAIAVEAWEPVFASFKSIMGDRLFSIVHSDWKEDKAGQIRKSAAPDSPVQFVIAEIDGDVAGFASWVVRDGNDNTIAEIGNNAVAPAHQNRGIATTLYGHILAACRSQGVAAIKVTTGLDPSHAPARAAYKKAGFAAPVPMVTYWQELD